MSTVQWNFGNPNVKQDAVMRLRCHWIGYGGARGGGKSWVVRAWSTLMAQHWAGIHILIVRQTYPELERNHIRPMREMTRNFAKYNDQKKLLTFGNGSTIEFGYCKNEGDMEHYQGGEWEIICIDEATNIPQECIVKFKACNRGIRKEFPHFTLYTMNPGGRSHAYFKRLFIDRNFLPDEEPDDYAFVQALVQDNAVLMENDPEYIKTLQSLPEKLRLAWLEGRWDVYSGQFFGDFIATPDSKGRCHVIDPFPPRPEWKIYHSYDYGYNRPFSMQWHALTPDNVDYLIMEWYGCGKERNTGIHMTADQQFTEIARIERTHPWLKGRRIYGWADPAIWEHESSGNTIAETAAKHGVYFDKADNDRINGWAEFHNRLYFDENGKAKFYVFRNCVDFITTLPSLQYDEHKVEDLDTEGEDHSADACRYCFMGNKLPPRIIIPEAPVLSRRDPLELYNTTRKTRLLGGR